MSTILKLLEELTDMRDDDVDELLEHAEVSETLTHRISVMLRTIVDLRERETRAKNRERKLEEALRKIEKLRSGVVIVDTLEAYRQEAERLAKDALEDEIPF